MSQLDKIYMVGQETSDSTRHPSYLTSQSWIVVILIFVMIFCDLIQFPMKVLFMGMKWRDSLQISEEDYRVITLGIPIEFHNILLLGKIDRFLMIFIFLSTVLQKW